MKTIKKVVDNGFCVGCGACAVVCNKIKMQWVVSEGRYFPLFDPALITEGEDLSFKEICPFSGDSSNEDSIAEKIFPKAMKKDKNAGNYLKSYAGFVAEGAFREKGSSGGAGSWLLAELFKKNIIDAVIHVQPRENKEMLFGYSVSRDLDAIKNGAKSRYYPIELSEVVRIVEENEGKYAIIGLPCFIKAIRLLSGRNDLLKNRIICHIGLVCGHLKSAYFAELLAWQAGISPKQLAGINFRHKLPDKPANQYAFDVVSKTGDRRTMAMSDVFGGDWGMGFFKFKACDYCDDVFAETSDVVIGDAWLPQYAADAGGTNIIVARTQQFVDLIDRGMQEGRLSMEEISIDLASKSQDAGLRHRREGLAYRLALTEKNGGWFPKKRVQPDMFFSSSPREKIYNARIVTQVKSQEIFKEARNRQNLKYFIQEMNPYVENYKKAYTSLWFRMCSKAKMIIKVLLKIQK